MRAALTFGPDFPGGTTVAERGYAPVLPRLCLGAALCCLSVAPASACDGQSGPILMTDSFWNTQGGWSFDERNFVLEAPGAIIKLPNQKGGSSLGVLYLTKSFDEGDFCVTGTFSAESLKVGAGFGVLFWAKDQDNFWVAAAYADGQVDLARYSNKNWLPVWVTKEKGLANLDPNAVNAVRVIARRDSLTVIFNGRALKTIRTRPLAAFPSYRFGIFAASLKPTSTAFTINIHSYDVTE